MAIARIVRQSKRPYGLWVKMTAVTVLGLCFIFVWSVFTSPSSSSVTTQRESFDDIAEPVSAKKKSGFQTKKIKPEKQGGPSKVGNSLRDEFERDERNRKKMNESASVFVKHRESKERNRKVRTHVQKKEHKEIRVNQNQESGNSDGEESEEDKEEDGDDQEIEGGERGLDRESETDVDTDSVGQLVESADQDSDEAVEDGSVESKKPSKRKIKGPLFDPKATYKWKLCSSRSKHNYIPCIDIEVSSGKLQSYRHTERSCPRTPLMCLVPLPREGNGSPVPWPESKSKVYENLKMVNVDGQKLFSLIISHAKILSVLILYKNVAHPKLAAYIKKHNWLVESGEYLTFPQNQSEFKGGILHYLESIEEMVPDIEWGKNVRVVLDIGCTDMSFGAALLDKEVLTLTLGLKDDLVDLAQVALERGFPAIVSPFGRRRLPFPGNVFDAIHCGGCGVSWLSNGGRLLLEMNRILRPGGYFLLSAKHNSIEEEEGLPRAVMFI